MVVAALLGLALALPTGALFGIGYGTGVRVGYEQVYPLLFPKGTRGDASTVSSTIVGINKIYDTIGGKEASQMGIAMGILSAKELTDHPDFQVLEQLQSKLSGPTSSNLGQLTPSETEKTMSSLAASVSSIASYMTGNKDFKPATILDIPLINNVEFEQGPPELSNKFGFQEKTLSYLVKNQTAFIAYREKHTNLHDWIKQKSGNKQTDIQKGNQLIKETPAPIKNIFGTFGPILQDYLVHRGRIWGKIQESKLKQKAYDSQGGQAAQSKSQNETRIMSKLRRELQNLIALARNNPATKGPANKDWNKRIWN